MALKILYFTDYNYCLLHTCLTREVVAEYTGERISSEEAAGREITYQEQENHPPAMYYIYRRSAKVV